MYWSASGRWLVRRYSMPMPSHGTCDPGKRRDAVRYAAIACDESAGKLPERDEIPKCIRHLV